MYLDTIFTFVYSALLVDDEFESLTERLSSVVLGLFLSIVIKLSSGTPVIITYSLDIPVSSIAINRC